MPWKIHLSTRLNMYSRRGYDEAAMNTDYLIWNASLSRSFLKDRLMVKVEGVDLLRQMRSRLYGRERAGEDRDLL